MGRFYMQPPSKRLPHIIIINVLQSVFYHTGDTKKRELLKNPTKIEEIQEKNLLTEIEPLQLAF